MNQRAFRRALRYGFGRAILHLQTHDAAPYRDDILAGCLHFQGFDADFDQDRPVYMFEIIALTGERAFYREHILAAAETATDEWDGRHVLALTLLFAEAGDDAAGAALDRALERLPFDHRLAKREIVRHGPEGLLRVLRLQRDHLASTGEDPSDRSSIGPWVIREATERWGKRAFATAMRDAGRADPWIKSRWAELREEEVGWRRRRGKPGELPAVSYEQANQILENPKTSSAPGEVHWSRLLKSWATKATDDEWNTLAEALASMPDDDPRWRRALRHLYKPRAYPGDPQRLIGCVRATRLDRFRYRHQMNDADRLATDAMNALAQVTHPDVRAFALELLETSKWTSHAATLLERNHVDGDLSLLAAVFRRERSEWQRHGIGISIRKIDEAFTPADAPPVLRYLYEHVRCGMCRYRFVEQLHAHGALPIALAEECCFDAEFSLRERIAELVPGVCASEGG